MSLFRSFHAAVAPILLQLRPESRILRTGLVVWMVAIRIACVLTKQHYLLDVVAGLAVGAAAVAGTDTLWTWARPHAVRPLAAIDRAT